MGKKVDGVLKGMSTFFGARVSMGILHSGGGNIRSAKSTIDKGKLVAAYSAYLAMNATPLGLLNNTARSIRAGFKEYHKAQDEEMLAALADHFAEQGMSRDGQDALRRAMRNPNHGNGYGIVLNNHDRHIAQCVLDNAPAVLPPDNNSVGSKKYKPAKAVNF